MEWIHSVRLRIILGFAFVIAPIVAFLFFNNAYSIRLVREQLSSNYDNLLQQYVQNTDKMLDETSLYLYRFVNDPDFSTLYASGPDSNEYYLTKIRIFNKLNSGIGYYNVISSLFMYSPAYKELLLASGEDHNAQLLEIGRHIDGLTRSGDGKWQLIQTSDGYAIAKIAVVSSEVVAGVWIKLDNLIEPLRTWNLGPEGEAAALDLTGGRSLLTPSRMKGELWEIFSEKGPGHAGNYLLIDDPSLTVKRLLVKADSPSTGVRYMLAVPETTILKSLPYFQKVVYIIPFGVLLVLGLYLSILQRVLIGPFSALIRGMRRIGQGKLDTRLHMPKRGEFAFLIKVFNDMAEQIRALKINVYEEKLRVQQAEYKHLQVQINPHFYMNSLNIIYNLAVLRDFTTLKKMALHLADYFRFTIHSNRSLITLAEELKHIGNYMEIQRLRYPDNLTYVIDLPPEFRELELPPLTVQPFVENAILHGFKNRNLPFEIRIEAISETGSDGMERVQVSVRDTGVGFSEEWLREFAATDWRSMQGEHVGIWNVMRRLDIHYGEAATVTLGNTEEGAEVLLRLPLHYTPMGEEPQDV
ncbi:sensor histidine kinase [Gorillibacterium sp. sgz5001074]|uniref:sensor histidine kinase n=1 Tax=Gorillibacterium sp. sgz5001074 TaxID=3446695 RepID=UPI003F66E094